MDEKTKKHLEIILSDCLVIDIDFSKWDKFISIVFVSDHSEPFIRESARKPIIQADFIAVNTFEVNFFHNTSSVFSESNEKHIQWNVDDYEWGISNLSNFHKLTIFQSGIFPKLTIEFKSVKLSTIRQENLLKLNPRWDIPNSGLARVGIKDLLKIL